MRTIKKTTSDGYMAICAECGGCEWVEEMEDKDTCYNSLEKDGTMLKFRELMSIHIGDDKYYYKKIKGMVDINNRGNIFDRLICSTCECNVTPIGFNKVTLSQRKEVACMTKEKRKEWLNNFKMLDNLEETYSEEEEQV